MASNENTINEPEDLNWLTGSRALKITKAGLRGLVENGSCNVQQNIHSSVIQAKKLTAGTTCSLCRTDNILPCPTKGLCSNPRNCKYHNNPSNIYRPCPSNICDDFRDEIIKVHKYARPSWKNSKADQWCTNHWEVAKCFMPPDGYHDVTSYDDTDFNGIINVMINCNEFQASMSFTIDNQPNALTEARDVGRKIRHSPDLKVKDTDLADYFATLNTLLTDSKVLASDKHAQLAVIKLKQLEKDVRETRAEQREDLRQRLVKYYQKQLNSAPISPLLSHKDEKLDKFYVPPKIVEKDHKRLRGDFPISSYKTNFFKDEGLGKTVFVVGEAGMGKSSFSAMCTLKWASQLSVPNKDNPEKGSDQGEEETPLFDDPEVERELLDFLKSIEFMFHLKLRNSCETCELSEMIKEQLIHMIYKADYERAAGYDTVVRVLTDQKCMIIADGLDEWLHPKTECKCSKKDKAIPHLSTSEDATVLITSRPWRMSRYPVKDTLVGKYFEIQGVASTKLLVQKLLVCLNERVAEKMKDDDFFLFVSRKKLDHLISVPIILMLLVCLWFEGVPESLSMCNIYAYMLDMMFGNKARPMLRVSSESKPLLRCFEQTGHVQRYYNIVLKLAQFAFETLFLTERKSSLVFQNIDCLTPEELQVVLNSGCMRETKSPSLIRELSSFSFIHKTVQEFLAAVHIAYHTKEIKRVMKPYYEVVQEILTSDKIYWENLSMASHDTSKVFIYMCGLNSEAAKDMSAMLSLGILNHPAWDYDLVSHDVNLAVQEIICSGYREAKANNVRDIQLSLHSFSIDGSTRDVATLKILLSMNKSQIRHIQIMGQEEISEEELQEVFTNSTDALTIEIRQRAGQYDLSACSRLQHLVIDGSKISNILINTKCLVSLAVYNVSEKVECSLLQSLKQYCENLKRFDICNLTNTSLFCQTLPKLNHLETLSIEETTLGDNPLHLPPSVTIVILTRVTVSAQSLREMVERVVNCSQAVRCLLSMCIVEPITDFEEIKQTTRTRKIFSYC
ncbi:uncharacterized protein LOC128209714 [Mya arenaria]|uniref:uncharacterized protein LOC128209714 n=1 Tax=Mya arenaria TaxID=6604 RepID=UPI0022E8B438|nr:uncharacterized protein LOC128209714 [Mya arenaria]